MRSNWNEIINLGIRAVASLVTSQDGPPKPPSNPIALRCKKEAIITATAECVEPTAPTSSGGVGARSRSDAVEEGQKIVFEGNVKIECKCKLVDLSHDVEPEGKEPVEIGECVNGKKHFKETRGKWLYLCEEWHYVDYGDEGGWVWEVKQRIPCRNHRNIDFKSEISMEDAKQALKDSLTNFEPGPDPNRGIIGDEALGEEAEMCGATKVEGKWFTYWIVYENGVDDSVGDAVIACMVGKICCGNDESSGAAIGAVLGASTLEDNLGSGGTEPPGSLDSDLHWRLHLFNCQTSPSFSQPPGL